MSTRAKKETNSIRVDESDSSSRVVFTPEDNDLFVLTCAQAVRAVKVGMNTGAFAHEVSELIQFVSSSLNKHKERIADCYAMPRHGELTFFVVAKSKTYDHDLAATLSQIDIKMAEKFQLIPSGVQQIPHTNIGVFVSDHAARIPLNDFSEVSSRKVAP